MSEAVRVAGVIGAGVMGTAIAAHLANAGLRVHLLDVVPAGAEGASEAARSALAVGAVKKALAAKPAPFFHPDAARLIQCGNLQDHLERLAECDLVIEAVVENMEIKKKVFSAIAPHLSERCVLASNTSGLKVEAMSEALPAALRARFLVMHFFNPVRYMRLLELIPGPQTEPATIDRMARFGELLGKGIVFGKDTTNFVANRIGVYGLMLSMHEMLKRNLTIEQVDAIAGRAMARPKSAAFNTCDLVGIDTMIHVAKNCHDSLVDDSEREVFKMPEFAERLAQSGRLGRKSGAGFYKKEGKAILVLDVETAEYRPARPVEFESLQRVAQEKTPGARVRTLVAGDDAAAAFAWSLVSKTLLYAARLIGEIADDIVAVDRAMRWGFNWELGPFEVWDALGVHESVQRMQADGLNIPQWVLQLAEKPDARFYQGSARQPTYFDATKRESVPLRLHPKQLRLAALKEEPKRVIRTNGGASLVDLGDGVLCLEVHTKMNTIDRAVIEMIDTAVDVAEGQFQALVIGNDSDNFSAGANLAMIAGVAAQSRWDELDGIIRSLQCALQRLKYAAVPVVTAPCQYTLGGGAELAMAGDASQAYAETYMGLVEVGVGLLPAGGGCLRLAERFTVPVMDIEGADAFPGIALASLNVAMAKTATSAEEARSMRYLRPTDGISLNREFLMYEAKQRALGMAGAGYRPDRPLLLKAAGLDAAKTIGIRIWGMVEAGYASEHDALIARKVAHVLCGGSVAAGTEVSEQHYLDLEREAFLQLCGEAKTLQRIEHMLKHGKPLRN